MLGRMLVLLLVAANVGAEGTPVQARSVGETRASVPYSAPAEVVSLNSSVLASELAAVIAQVNVDVGEAVTAGQILVTLDCRDYDLIKQEAIASMNSAGARLERAQQRLQRAQRLNQQQYVSPDELLERQTDVAVVRADQEVLESQLARAARQLEKCVIRAPFEGVVLDRQAQLGAFASIGEALLTLVQSDVAEVDVAVPAALVQSLPQQAYFVVNQQRWPVRLLRLSSLIEAPRRTQRARFGFEHSAAPIGSSGALRWQSRRGLLPADILARRGGDLGVFTVLPGQKVRFLPLPGAQEGRPASTDLADHILLVVAGHEQLQDGDQVEIQQ